MKDDRRMTKDLSVVGLGVGERVRVRAYKSDGTCYRWRWATVEAVERDQVVVVSPVGQRVEDVGGAWASEYAVRAYFWPDRWYSLMEVYTACGKLDEIYVHISSPVEIRDGELRCTDYELDVSRKEHEARIVDGEEFREAAVRYGYSEAFQQACYEVAREALAVAEGWVALGMPAGGLVRQLPITSARRLSTKVHTPVSEETH